MSSYDPELERLVKELNQTAKAPAAPFAANIPPAKDAASLDPLPLDSDVDQTGRPDLAGADSAVPAASASSASLDGLLRYSVERGASDIILVAGCGLVLRVNGKLAQTKSPEFSDDEIRALMLPLLTPGRRQELEAERSVDFSFVRKGIGRFRTNIHFQRGALGATIRILPASIPTIEELHCRRR